MKRSFCVLFLVFLSIVNSGVLRAQEKSHSEGLDLSRKKSETLDLSREKKDGDRPVDETPRITGSIKLKPFGSNKEWPYLKSNNKEYRLETTDPKVVDQITQCETGDVCTVKGEFVEGAEPIIKAKSVKIESYGEQKLAGEAAGGEVTTVKGCKFKRDNFNPALGETWKSPKGTVWGELELNADGSPAFKNFKEADALCAKKGARLPKGSEWLELASCFDGFKENTAPFRNLDLKRYWSSESLPQTARLFNTKKVKFGSWAGEGWGIRMHAVDEEDRLDPEDDDVRAFVRCVGAHSD